MVTKYIQTKTNITPNWLDTPIGTIWTTYDSAPKSKIKDKLITEDPKLRDGTHVDLSDLDFFEEGIFVELTVKKYRRLKLERILNGQ